MVAQSCSTAQRIRRSDIAMQTPGSGYLQAACGSTNAHPSQFPCRLRRRPARAAELFSLSGIKVAQYDVDNRKLAFGFVFQCLFDGWFDVLRLRYPIAVATVGFAVELVVGFWRDMSAVVNAGVLRDAVGKIFNQASFHR